MPRLSFFVFSVTKPFLRYIVGLLVVAVGWAVIVNTQSYLVKLIIDRVSAANSKNLFQELLPIVILYIFMGLCFSTFFRIHDYLTACFIPKQKEFIALQLMQRMMDHSASFYQRNFAGNLTNKINDLTIHTPELIHVITENFATCLFTALVVLWNVFQIHSCFAWALGIWLFVFTGGGLWILFSKSHFALAAAESRSQVVGHIVDMLLNISSIRLFARAKHENSLMRKVTSAAAVQEKVRDVFFMKLHFFQAISYSIFEGICFWWLLQGISQKTITPGGFVLVFTLNLHVLEQFWDLSKEIRDFWEKAGHMNQALRLIYEPQDQVDGVSAKVLQVTEGHIVFERVHFFYEGAPLLFEEKTVEIMGGQKVGLVGYSGSGKSTFLSLILRLYDATQGRILIDGQDIRAVTHQSLYRSISVVLQDCSLFNRSILENIRYGNSNATEEEIYEAAKKAQIHDVILRMPHGYHTMAGEKGNKLSGGQRQRVAIARAIVKDAPILLMDEATSHLDMITEEKVKKAFQEVMQKKTVVMIAHRLSTLKALDRILVFHEGKIVQDGYHEALLYQEGLYRDLWDAQSNEIGYPKNL